MLHQQVSVLRALFLVQPVPLRQLIALLAMDPFEQHQLVLVTRVIIIIQVLAHYVLHLVQHAHQQLIAQHVKMQQ